MTLVPSSSRGSTVTGIEITDGITDVTGATKVTASGGLVVGGTSPNATLAQGAAPAAGLGVYGDGSDGAQTFDGTTTILGIVPSTSTYTLARDIFLTSSTINNGVSIITNGFRIFCQGTLTNNGTIQWNGNAGGAGGTTVGGTGGAALGNTNATINSNAATSKGGGAGSETNGGSGTNAAVNSLGGAGGTGGAGSNGTSGTGGTVTGPTATNSPPRFLPLAVIGQTLTGADALNIIFGGAGGGGGGGDTSNVGAGGGGGSGGGIVVAAAKVFAGTGAIQARGGAGGNGHSPGTFNVGGGGGGGGGLVIVVSSSVSSGAISGQTIDANGGAHGTSNGSGGGGITNGSNGTVILLAN